MMSTTVLKRATFSIALVAAVVLPLLANPYWTFVASFSLVWGLMILSLSLLAGWSGEVSLAAAAFLGVGAIVADWAAEFVPFPLEIGIGVAASIPISILIGLPALRLRGLYLMVVTLAFMIGMQDAVFPQLIGRESNIPVDRPVVFGIETTNDRVFYLVVLLIAAIVIGLSLQVGRSMLRRRFVALNEEPIAFASLGGNRVSHKLLAFILSGVVASLAGALWGMLNRQLSGGILTVSQSILFLAMAIVAGRGSVIAAFIGGALFVVLPEVFRNIPAITQYTVLISGAAMVLLLIQYPGGLASMPDVLAEMKRTLQRRRGVYEPEHKPPASIKDQATAPSEVELSGIQGWSLASADSGEPLLEVDKVTVRFGGVTAVNEVSLRVANGGVVGLIGPNGAGKTTLMNVVSGYLEPDHGTTSLNGTDISDLSVTQRSLAGIGRTFQTPKVFPSLTLEENVLLGMTLGSGHPARELMASALRYATGDERARSTDLLRLTGLASMANQRAGEVPHGVARLLEVSRALAAEPRLLLLDEPVAGLDEGESDAFGDLVGRLQEELGISILVVEHDVRWIEQICEQLYVLDFGRLIASGPTAQVMADKRVRDAYLGKELDHIA